MGLRRPPPSDVFPISSFSVLLIPVSVCFSHPFPLQQLKFEYFIHRRCDRMHLLASQGKKKREKKKKSGFFFSWSFRRGAESIQKKRIDCPPTRWLGDAKERESISNKCHSRNDPDVSIPNELVFLFHFGWKKKRKTTKTRQTKRRIINSLTHKKKLDGVRKKSREIVSHSDMSRSLPKVPKPMICSFFFFFFYSLLFGRANEGR